MTCGDVTITSQTRHFEFEAAILNPRLQSYSWQWRNQKMCNFVLRNILSQNKHIKVKDYLRTNEGEETEKRLKKRQKMVKIHFWVNGCYGNVSHHRHVIDTGKFSLINVRKRHEIWRLFFQPFKCYNSLKSVQAQWAPTPPLPG